MTTRRELFTGAAAIAAATLPALPALAIERPKNWPSQSFHAEDWAQEFNAVLVRHGHRPMDEGFLISWFANALMRGYDEHASLMRLVDTNRSQWRAAIEWRAKVNQAIEAGHG